MFESVNVDQFAIDLHFFLKLSPTRREDCRGVSELTDVTTHYVIKHCQARWLSLDKVLGRIIEQYENLWEYFLKTLRNLGLKGKMESIKLNVTKELRISWEVRLHLHRYRSLSMCVKVSKNLLFLCNPLSQNYTCCTQSALNGYRICSQDS